MSIIIILFFPFFFEFRSQSSLYTAQILFNQFFARQSFLDYPLVDVVMASVFVAGKVEECIRRARDIVNVFHHLFCLIRSLPAHPIDYVGDTYYIWRDRLCTTEAHLLRELGFHVQPASPVGLLLGYMKILEFSDISMFSQVALNYLNDALKSSAYILFQPRIIAVSAISLALDHLNLTDSLLPPPESLQFPWYTLFDVNETELKECNEIVLTVYKREFDVMLPITKEELSIFSTSIRPQEENKEEKEKEHYSREKREDCECDTRREYYDRDERSRSKHYRDDRYNNEHDSRDHSSHSHSSRDYKSSRTRNYGGEEIYHNHDNRSHSHSRHSHDQGQSHSHAN